MGNPSDIQFRVAELAENAAAVAEVLKAVANRHRLLILCLLAREGELAVNTLVERVGLSQSALSQHLAKLREEQLVSTRREAQTIWYRISDQRVAQLMDTLHDLYCPPRRNQAA